MAATFILYSYLSTPGATPVTMEGAAFAAGKLVMASPKLEGFTKDGRAYVMTAVRAIQNFDQQGAIDLEGIDARMPVDKDNWARVEAKTGVYDRDSNTLQLNTDIVVTTTDGMTARLNSAFLDVGKGTLKSADPVAIERLGTKITADSMEMLDNGKLLIFEKRVRMNIEPQELNAGAQPSGDTNASN